MMANDQTLDELLIELESGSISEQQRELLRSKLRESEEARKQFLQWQMLSAAMQLESASGGMPIGDDASIGLVASQPDPQPDSTPVQPTNRPKPRLALRWKSLLTLAAGVGLCLLATRWAYLEWGGQLAKLRMAAEQTQSATDFPSQARNAEATASGIAMVTRLVDAKWDDTTPNLEIGTALKPGAVSLQSGYAQIEFFCGATVVLEGPAQMELISSTSAKFLRGRLRATVPPAARGFEIDVDDMKVVDLGTEFGLAVTDKGADVQVFDGEVELHRSGAEKQLLTAGQAIQRDNEQLSHLAATPDQFVDLASLDTQARGQTAQRYQRWLAYSRKLRKDSRLIAYYAMDETQPWNRKLLNKAEPSKGELAASEYDGAIVGASRIAGRWRDKDSLEFKQPGDRVRVNVPGEFRSLTFAVWVKIDSLDRWYNSLFLTDSYQKGEPHWQILDTGQLFFSVRAAESVSGPEHKKVLSPPFWNPSLSGRWLHLATTYDVDAKQTIHYLNGKQIHQETIPDFQLVETTRIGMASIGNWSMPTKEDDHFAVRNLNGSLDELAIFKAALSPEEIAQMYEHGRP
ncbi:LamG-like jellyroll fold domain-containing protein [Stieleria marina]|uniref:FecR protein n=1 Tax=Stieleria marina TaxID=1930275 RepID=A0A517P0C2_9BACT|nr:FecR protein [Planctomycetes bacterium K23_9]